MKTLFPALFAALVMTAAVSPACAADGPQPGLWKMTVQVSHPGAAPLTRSQDTCITPEQAKKQQEGAGGPTGASQQNCKRVNFQRTARGMTMRYQCGGPMALDMTMTYAYDGPAHYTVAMNSSGTRNGTPFKSSTNIDARRIGECPK